MILETNSGRKIDCSLISTGQRYPVLIVYTHALSAGDAWELFFDNPDETGRMVWIHDDGTRQILRHFTQLHSIAPTTIASGEQDLQIWMDYQIPIETDPEEDDSNG